MIRRNNKFITVDDALMIDEARWWCKTGGASALRIAN